MKTKLLHLLFLGAALIVLVVALIGIFAVVLHKGQPGALAHPAASSAAATATVSARPVLTVTVQAPERMDLDETLEADGNVAAWQEASIGSESNGLRLAQVRVNVGERVKKGQVLATFADASVRADVAQARAALAQAQASAVDAARTAARARKLQNTGALSQIQIDQYQTAEQTAQARVQAAQAALDAQQVRARNARVLAPDDGVISARSASVGAVTGAGMELFRLIRGGRIEWRAEVTASDLARIHPGMRVRITGVNGAQVMGTVRGVAPTVNVQTRNALVYVDLPGGVSADGADLKAGMFAHGEFELGRSSARIVPQEAVAPRDGFNNVLLLRPDQHVTMVRVHLGRQLGDRVEIKGVHADLPADARIVVQGAGFLNDGDLVRVVDSAPAPASIKK
ncbi:MAG: efflux RND transporter periplasmic adaptor subunit [Burkholderiaceae bacterium]|jgi:RND family efflux transporter MFP subunit|nr:efflux RND transporter periplasmic adaptor subunit [Burkholderiaceae bacterium]